MSDTLITEGATTTGADQQQAATSTTEGQQAAGGEQGATQQQSTEGQNTEGQQAEGAKTDDGQAKTDDKPAGAPEKYEFKAPEGREFDAKVLEQFSEVAKELNLSEADAQKVIDKIAPALAAKQTEVLEAARVQWETDAKGDKEFGGDKLTENLAVAKKALDKFGTPELRELLNTSGLGNHPEIIRAFYRAGKAISEDKFVGGNPSPGDGKSLADRLYSTS